MSDFLAAIGLLLFVEGAVYALAPQWMKRALLELLNTDDGALRIGGISAAVAGVLLVWFVRG